MSKRRRGTNKRKETYAPTVVHNGNEKNGRKNVYDRNVVVLQN